MEVLMRKKERMKGSTHTHVRHQQQQQTFLNYILACTIRTKMRESWRLFFLATVFLPFMNKIVVLCARVRNKYSNKKKEDFQMMSWKITIEFGVKCAEERRFSEGQG